MATSSLLTSPLVKELMTCKLCSKFFDAPRLLPCQHTFCTACLHAYLERKEVEARRKLVSIRCPECFDPAALPLGGIDFFPADHKADKIRSLLQDVMMHSILRNKQSDLENGRPRSGSNARSRPLSYNLENIDLNTLAAEIHPQERSADRHSASVSLPSNHSPLSAARGRTQEAGTSTHEDVTIHRLVGCEMQDCASQTDSQSPPASRDYHCGGDDKSCSPDDRFHSDNNNTCKEEADEGYDTLGSSSTTRKRSATLDDSTDSPPPRAPLYPTATASAPHSKRSCQTARGSAGHTADSSLHTAQPCQGPASQHCGESCESPATQHKSCTAAANVNSSMPFHEDNVKSASETVKQKTLSSELNNNNCNDKDSFVDGKDNGVLTGEDCAMNGHPANGVLEDGEETFTENGEADYDTPPRVYDKAPAPLWCVEKQDHDMPTDILVTPAGGVAVADYGNCRLQFFEASGEYIHSIDNIKPFSVAFDRTHEHFVVADRKDKSIKVFDQGGGMLYDWEKNSFHWICGLAVTRAGHFVVFDRELTKIGVYDQEGTRLAEFGSYGDGDSHLCMADFLTVDSQDRIIVCDSGHHCVKVFDTSGAFLGRFSGRGTGAGQLLWPKSVCVDAADNILVTDQRNNRISLFSPDGRFIQHVLPSCHNPYNLSLNASGVLGVTSYDLSGASSIGVYQL